jgi:acyl-coenzyme A synthetase/AMP-(fatty) acid ligase
MALWKGREMSGRELRELWDESNALSLQLRLMSLADPMRMTVWGDLKRARSRFSDKLEAMYESGDLMTEDEWQQRFRCEQKGAVVGG